MKLKHLLPLAFAALPLLATARPACPGLVSHTNPDGSVTQIRVFGDESFSFVTDADQTVILEQNDRGFYTPAQRNGRTLSFNDSSIELLKTELPAEAAPRKAGAMRGGSSLNRDGRSTFPTLGENHFPVVLIEYSDKPFISEDPATEFYNLCNQADYPHYAACGSIRDYYMASSNNAFQPVFDVYGPIKLSKTSAYYVDRGGSTHGAGKYGRFGEALSEAMNKLKSQGVDFSQYDHNNDGDIDFVYFFYSGYSQADTGRPDTVWPHQGDFYNSVYFLGLSEIYMNGLRFGPYATSSELRGVAPYGQPDPCLDGIGAFCHEFGHVLGLPDLYDAPRQSGTSTTYTKTPGVWTVMDSGTYNGYSTCPPVFSAYEQWVCNWLEFDELNYDVEGKHCKVNPLGDSNRNAYRIQLPKDTDPSKYYNEYYIFENRKLDSWDSYLPEEGMLVWRVNYNATTWGNNRVNTGGVSNVEILASSDSNDKTTYPVEESGLDAIYKGCEGELIHKNTANNFRYFITGITRNADKSVDFDYNAISEQPSAVTLMHNNPTREKNKRYVYLTWDAHPDADGYYVTVTTTNSSGTVKYVDGFNEKYVGNVNRAEVLNITSTQFKQNFKAYVRVKSGIPSSKISNIIEFVPNELENYDPSGVGEINIDAMCIRGLRGEIEAPEDARIFNMSGIETGRHNLPAGIYLVKVGNEVKKVSVR